jgi:hypothetical protein
MLSTDVLASVILCSRDTPIRKLFCTPDVLCRNIVAVVLLYLRDCSLYGCVLLFFVCIWEAMLDKDISVVLLYRRYTRFECCCSSPVFEIYKIRMLLQFFSNQNIADSNVIAVLLYSRCTGFECHFGFCIFARYQIGMLLQLFAVLYSRESRLECFYCFEV